MKKYTLLTKNNIKNKVEEEIEDSKKLYKYLSKTNFTNILKYTKDELNIEKGD